MPQIESGIFIRKKQKKVYKNQSDTFKKTFQSRLFDSYEALENSPDFEPVTLGPLYLRDGRPALYLLKESERNFLFHILLKSIPYQISDELNNQFDILNETELKLSNKNRSLWMEIQWASSLYYSGDYKASKKYFNEFDKDFRDYYPEKSLIENYYILKYKLSKIFDDIVFTEQERSIIKESFKNWFMYYEQAEVSDAKGLYPILNNLIISRKKTNLDLYNERELHDFINFLIWRSIELKNPDSFFDAGYFKQKIKSINDKILKRMPKFSDLPEFKPVAIKLKSKIPSEQLFIGLIDFGIETYSVRIENNSSSMEIAFKDNRETKFSILEYLYTIRNGGMAVVIQESIEDKYRKALKLSKKKLTYLYLPSYHFKITIEPEEEEYFYYTANPEAMIERNIYNPSSDFNPGFSIINKSIFSNNKPSWKSLKKLEEFELKYLSGNNYNSKITVSMEELELNKGRQILFGGYPLNELNSISKRNGVWILASSSLTETSLHNDDFFNSIQYLDSIHYGPGILSTGIQNNTNNAFFMKQFLKKSDMKIEFMDRFLDAFQEIKLKFEEDRYWQGWKPYTNVFIKNK